MKKIIFISLVIAQLFGGGYYPSYGPGQLWNPSVSTSSGMVMFDEITIFGTPIVSGQEGGSTGACDSQNCDILAAMYNGICIGWTYMPIINETITLAVNFDDGVTPSVEGYPSYTRCF